ncbi:MAG: T9SS type A sorting domain-containing protein [candidate division WOR-3 bacterium]
MRDYCRDEIDRGRLSLAGIIPGVYLVKLQTPDREITRKLVVR